MMVPYSEKVHELEREAVGGGLERVRIGQPCFTAHGDKEEYERLDKEWLDLLIKETEEYKKKMPIGWY